MTAIARIINIFYRLEILVMINGKIQPHLNYGQSMITVTTHEKCVIIKGMETPMMSFLQNIGVIVFSGKFFLLLNV